MQSDAALMPVNLNVLQIGSTSAYVFPPGTQEFLDVRFPRPFIRMDWLTDTARTLEEANLKLQNVNDDLYGDGLLAFFEALESRVLCAKFSEIMQAGSGLPPQINLGTMHAMIKGPIVLELIHLTDVGCSALALEKVRILRDQLTFQYFAGAAESRQFPSLADYERWENDLPAFPRGSLKLLLTDGFTELEGRELKPLPLRLGQTPMGLKVALRDVPVIGGIAYLQPSNFSVCGGSVHERKEQHTYRLQAEFRSRVQEKIKLVNIHGGTYDQLFSVSGSTDT